MNIFFETPIPVLLVALITAFVLGFFYINTGRRSLLVAMGAVAALAIVGILVERYVKTDREKIADTLDQLALAIEAHDLPENSAQAVTEAVYRLISEDAHRTRGLAAANFLLAKITSASYSNLEVDLNKLSLPPSAEVRFDAKISGEGRGRLSQVVTRYPYPLEFRIKMVYEKDRRCPEPRWLIGDRVAWRLKTLGNDADPTRFGFDTGETEMLDR